MTGNRRALITGSAGFIGYHLAARLLAEGWEVLGLDAMTDYYDVALKERRHALLAGPPPDGAGPDGAGLNGVMSDGAGPADCGGPDGVMSDEARPADGTMSGRAISAGTMPAGAGAPGRFHARRGRLEEPGLIREIMAGFRPEAVIHLAAQAGVRHSIDAPRAYVETNLTGTFELLEAARAHPPAHLMLASTSAVYGARPGMPCREIDRTDHPVSFYAATKKAVEAMAHSYAQLYAIPTTVLRFFTVYGPWGRPDMAPFKFTRAVLEGRAIDIYNHGDMQRDFTYVDDLVDGVAGLIPVPPGREPVGAFDSLSPVAPWRAVNIGNGAPVPLMDFVAAIEAATGRVAVKNFLPMQPGDVPATWADARLVEALLGRPLPRTDIRTGMARLVDWYRGYHGV